METFKLFPVLNSTNEQVAQLLHGAEDIVRIGRSNTGDHQRRDTRKVHALRS